MFSATVPRIGALEAREKQEAGALMLDVRTPLERKLSKMPGSQGLPLAELAKPAQRQTHHLLLR